MNDIYFWGVVTAIIPVVIWMLMYPYWMFCEWAMYKFKMSYKRALVISVSIGFIPLIICLCIMLYNKL